MRTNSSPTAEAARLLAACDQPPSYAVVHPAEAQTSTSQTGTTDQLWCDWPRRTPAPAPRRGRSANPFTSVRSALQALQAIQARHA